MKTALLTYLATPLIVASTLGAEFQVNTRTSDDQKDAAIAADATGNFLVVWNSYRQDGDSGGIFGQRFDPNGTPLGDEFQINTTIAGNQARPAVAADAAGNFVVAWQGPGVSEDDIFAQSFDPNGQPVGQELQVNSFTDGTQQEPAVAMNAGGAFAVVWESQNVPQDANKTSICGQLYDSAGLPVAAEFTINTEIAACRYPDVAMDDDGNFAITWLNQNGANSIMLRAYSAEGTADAQPFKLNTVRFSSVTQPGIAIAGTERFVVVWDGDPNRAGDDDIHALRFPPDQGYVANQFMVNTTRTGAQQNPKVAVNSRGEFVIVWDSETGLGSTERDIFGQRFDSSGNPVGDEFQLNTFVEGDQKEPVVAMSEDGCFVTVWESDGQDGSRCGIFGRIGPIVGSADCNADGCVNFLDYCTLAAEWHKTENPLKADLVDDNRIDERDLAAFCQEWLKP
jgi:hypothetical protein